MRCFSCHRLSLKSLCHECQVGLFLPTIKKRFVGSLEVVSFYRYSTIEPLLLQKHKPNGYRIFNNLAEITMQPFIKNFLLADPTQVSIIGIDERVESGYSHVACLTHKMKTENSIVLPASLLSQNRVKYAGKTLQYRLDNPRDFLYRGPSNIDVILVDDIVTTGSTLHEAKSLLTQYGINTLFALTLADARE